MAEIEKILTLECNLRSLAIFWEWNRALKRAGTPQRNGYIWDGLLNPTVYISYILEIGFLLLLSLIKLS